MKDMLLSYIREREEPNATGPASVWGESVTIDYGDGKWDCVCVSVEDLLEYAINYGRNLDR